VKLINIYGAIKFVSTKQVVYFIILIVAGELAKHAGILFIGFWLFPVFYIGKFSFYAQLTTLQKRLHLSLNQSILIPDKLHVIF
jgi:hypothetical protein